MRRLFITFCLLAGLALYSVPAFAQTHVGVRSGVSSRPDQFVFGGHLETPELLPHLTFRPNVEVGVGDHTTLVALNVEFVYSIPLQGHAWRIYAGAGPAANIFDHRYRSGSSVGGGVNFLVGAEHDGGLFTEFKVGAIDSPTVKFIVGYTFK